MGFTILSAAKLFVARQLLVVVIAAGQCWVLCSIFTDEPLFGKSTRPQKESLPLLLSHHYTPDYKPGLLRAT